MECKLWLRIEHDENETDHFVRAYVQGEPNQIGVIAWSKVHGGLGWETWTDERYRRQGVATALWNAAVAGNYDPPIRLNGKRTAVGHLWAASLDVDSPPVPWDGRSDTYWVDA